MSAYGAIAYQFKVHRQAKFHACKLMLTSPKRSGASIEAPSTPFTTQQSPKLQDIEIGTDPLQLPNDTDFSFCTIDLKDCSSPKPGTSSPASEPGFVIPKDYGPHHTSLETEPYVMAEKVDLFLGSYKETPSTSRGSLDLSSLPNPGTLQEQSMRSIPSLYPDISQYSSTEDSYKSAQSSSQYSPTSFALSRSNPFNKPLPRSSRPAVSTAGETSGTEPIEIVQAHSNFYTPLPPASVYLPSEYIANPAYRPPKPVKSQSTHDTIENAVRGTLNNAVQSFNNMLASNNFESSNSICFLGQLYRGKPSKDDKGHIRETESLEDNTGSFKDFLMDFQSRVWVTYRRGFTCLSGTTITSDTGWGCMLRTGQMMLATALQIHCWKRSWRRYGVYHNQHQFRQLVKLFGEGLEYPFSLQKLLTIGKNDLNKAIGEWYGPSTVAYVLRECLDYAKANMTVQNISPEINISDLTIVTASDCMLFKDDIVNAATKNGTGVWTKILVLVSVRMGADDLNQSYYEPIQAFLSSRLCVGIMGGRKRHSLYFVGFQDKKLIHYDPHVCHTVEEMSGDFSTETYICHKPRKMSFSKMDPSCTFAFYLQSQHDLNDLIKLSEGMGSRKIFELLDGTKENYLTLVYDPSVRAFDHNESMFEDGGEATMADIASLEGSDFEYLE